MLVLELLTENGRAGFAGSAQTTLAGPISVAIPAGAFGLVHVASGALSLTSGATDEHTLADDQGSFYEKLSEVTQAAEPFRTGVTESVWAVRPDITIPAGTVLTATFSAAVQGLAWSVGTFDPQSIGNNVTLAGIASDHGSADGSSDPAVTLTPAASDDLVWVGFFAFDAAANLTIPITPGWAEATGIVQNGGGNFNGMTLVSHYRPVEASSQRWEILNTLGSRRYVIHLAAFKLTAPVVAVPVGTREFQADFDTATDGVVRASTSLFPDAITPDYRQSRSYGPATINDPTGGVEAIAWQAVALPTEVTIAAALGLGYDMATTLFSYSGAVIDYLSLCFSASGRPVVVCQRGTGAAGAPEVWLYRWDEGTTAFVFENLGLGRTPRALLDAFPHLSSHCAPTPDVQVVFLRPGPGPDEIGLVRLEEREDFATIHGSPLPYVDNIGILDFYPSVARELVVKYGRHDVVTGKWEEREVVSLPYDDALLKRPSFGLGIGDLAGQYRGQPMYNPPTGSSTDDYTLRVNSVDAVDVIELQCANSVPGGVQPDDTGGIWTVQVQESPGAVGAGGGTTFTISVVHGGGSMSPRAFRARTRKVIGAATCYSPWRYFVISSQGDPDAYIADVELVNCGHDVTLCLFGPAVWQFGAGGLGPHFCESEVEVSSAACAVGGIGYFVGGWFTGISGWRQDWAVQVRTAQSLVFTDQDLIYSGTLTGDVFKSFTSGAGWPLPNPNQYPMQIPA